MAASINIAAYSDALVVLGTAGIVVPLVRRSGISPVLGYLGAGMLLGPLGLGTFVEHFPLLYWLTVVEARNVAGIAELGVVFLLFLIGLELGYARLVSMRRLVFGLGSLQIIASTVAIAGIATAFGLTPAVAIVIGGALAHSSTAIVLETLGNTGRMNTGTGRASLSVLLAQDLAVVPLLMLIAILGARTSSSLAETVAIALLQAAIALTIIVAIGRFLLRPMFRLVGNTKSSELFIAAALFVIVLSGVVAAQAGLSMALGAFVAGLMLAETAYRKAIEATIEPVKGLLLGIFFFTVGMSIDIRVLLRDPGLLIAAVIGLIVLKASITTAFARLYQLSSLASLETGLLLGPGGEFAFVAIALAAEERLTTQPTTGFIIAVTALSMTCIPLMPALVRRLSPLLAPKAPAEPAPVALPLAKEHHTIVFGYGRVGKTVSSLLAEHKLPYTAADFDAATVSGARRAGFEVYFGNAASPAFLNACGLQDASCVIVTFHKRDTVDAIVSAVRTIRPDIMIVCRAKDADHARHLYEIGATDAVPDTIEASLQLSEAALVGLGVPTGLAIASIHARRDVFRTDLRRAAQRNGDSLPYSLRNRAERMVSLADQDAEAQRPLPDHEARS